MIYFDTDVLINFLISQDSQKHQQANALYHAATDAGRFFISLLCLQETAFVLHRLNQSPDRIEKMLGNFLPTLPVPYNLDEMKRAINLGKLVGFQNMNDCLHTAIAETHCDELYTFNKSDFKRIQRHTKLHITTL